MKGFRDMYEDGSKSCRRKSCCSVWQRRTQKGERRFRKNGSKMDGRTGTGHRPPGQEPSGQRRSRLRQDGGAGGADSFQSHRSCESHRHRPAAGGDLHKGGRRRDAGADRQSSGGAAGERAGQRASAAPGHSAGTRADQYDTRVLYLCDSELFSQDQPGSRLQDCR